MFFLFALLAAICCNLSSIEFSPSWEINNTYFYIITEPQHQLSLIKTIKQHMNKLYLWIYLKLKTMIAVCRTYLLPPDEEWRCLEDISLLLTCQQDSIFPEHMASQDLMSLLHAHTRVTAKKNNLYFMLLFVLSYLPTSTYLWLFLEMLKLYWCWCFSAKTYLQDRSVLLCISYRLPYLSDPVVLLLYQQGKVTHEGWRCPLHSNSPVDTETGRRVSVNCLPDSKTLETNIYRQCHEKDSVW